jgi:hypothetical protein
MMPPTIRKLLTDIPKNLKSNCPEKAKATRVIKATRLAFWAVFRLSSLVRLPVMERNTGMIPRGFISVIKEVKHNKAKPRYSSIGGQK